VAHFVVLQPDPLFLARLRGALEEQHDLMPVADWQSLREALQRLPAEACVLDPYGPGQVVGMREVQRLRKHHPTVAIVVYADFRGREMDLFTLGRLQVDGVVPAQPHDGPWQIRTAISDALARAVAARVVAALGARLPRVGLDCLRWAIENANRGATVADLARHFSRSPDVLARRLRRKGSPPPERILLWGRIFRATHLLTQRGSTVEGVAYEVGYSSAAALARALRSATGHSPTGIRRRGGVPCALDGFFRKEARPLRIRTGTRWRIGSVGPALHPRKEGVG